MSSILDALRKLEADQPAAPGGKGLKNDLFTPPQRPRRRARVAAIGILALILAAGAWLFVRNSGEPARTAPSAKPAPLAQRAPVAKSAQVRPQPTIGYPSRLSPQARVMRERMLARYMQLKGHAPPAPHVSVPSAGAAPNSVATGQAEAPGAAPATRQPAPAIVPTAPTAGPTAGPASPITPPAVPNAAPAPVAAAPPAVAATPQVAKPAITTQTPQRVASASRERLLSAPVRRTSGHRPATRTAPVRPAAPRRLASAPPARDAAPAPAAQTAPVILVTEVTWHDDAARRSAHIQIGAAKPRLVHEGDRIEGVKVVEIRAGAVALDMGGDSVELEVGESRTLRTDTPVYH